MPGTRTYAAATLLSLFSLTGCGRDAEARTLTNDAPLYAPPLSEKARADRQAKLQNAEAALRQKPEDPDALIWVGRRQAYLGRYRQAIETFTSGIAKHPGDARFLRHRGHRYITVRDFKRAIADLEKARKLVSGQPDEVEPDGMPNKRNQPTSTLQFNIHYHLGLAHYLAGDLESALRSYRDCLQVSKNPDALCATTHWTFMTLLRLGRRAEATAVLDPIHPEMDVIENQSYYQLCLMYKGHMDVEKLKRIVLDANDDSQSAALAYGFANWIHYNGQQDVAKRLMEMIVGWANWPAFGHIAAEADLARRK